MNVEIAAGAVNVVRLENALRNSDFIPEEGNAWKWFAQGTSAKTVVKFELLADLDNQPANAVVAFDECDDLAAINLRGTGYAVDDVISRELTAIIGGVQHIVEVNVTGVAGFLVAKAAAAHTRRSPKDWYDIAFVLLHNDEGGPQSAAALVRDIFGDRLDGPIGTALDDLSANFANPDAQGPAAYAIQMTFDYPDISPAEAKADAVSAVEEFRVALLA